MSIVSEAATWAGAERRAEKIEKHMSKPGKLKGISPILEERRLRYGIPDEAFRIQAAFKRIYVKQIEEWDGETYGPESRIIKTQITQQRGRESTPRGIIVSAGLEALDSLISHGMDVGDVVWIVQLAMFRLPVLEIDGKDEHVLVLQVGDVTGAEDTMARLRSGELSMKYDAEAGQHYYEWRGRESMRPKSPWISDEF